MTVVWPELTRVAAKLAWMHSVGLLAGYAGCWAVACCCDPANDDRDYFAVYCCRCCYCCCFVERASLSLNYWVFVA